MRKTIFSAFVLITLLLAPTSASAQPVLEMNAAPETIRNALTQSFQRAQAGAVTQGTPNPPAVGFLIEFEFDSARLTTAGALFLGRIIEILVSTSQLAGVRLLIDGHADAVGSREYNQALGQARANTILAAIAQQGFPPWTLFARSFGEDRPLYGLSPYDGRNRRVEITPF